MAERGERGGAVLDSGGAEESVSLPDTNTGGEGNVTLEKIETTDQVVDEQGGESDPNGEAEIRENGKDGGVNEGEVREETPSPKSDLDPRIENIEKAIKAVSEKLEQKPPEPQKPMSDEDWAKLEQEWGAPRSTIERVTRQNVQVVNKITEYIDAKFAKLEFAEALGSFAREPGFSDATRYKKEVTEFLGDYDPKYWTNPNLLKKAVYYARGMNANSNVQKARTDSERNRVIAGTARPSSPGSGQRRVNMPPLTASQKAAAELMPGGVAEYEKFKRNGRVILE